MSTSILTRIVIETVVFFGLSSEDVVQSDVAVSQLEAIASALHELTDLERQEFLNFANELAAHEEGENGKTLRVDFLLSLGENLGLI